MMQAWHLKIINLKGGQHDTHHKCDQWTSAMKGYLGSCWTGREPHDCRSYDHPCSVADSDPRSIIVSLITSTSRQTHLVIEGPMATLDSNLGSTFTQALDYFSGINLS